MKEKRRENIIIVSIVTVAIIVLAVVLLNNSNVFKKSSNTTSKTQDAKQYESFINELSNYVENSDPNKDYDTTKSDFVTEVIDLQKKYQDSTGVSYAANTLINDTNTTTTNNTGDFLGSIATKLSELLKKVFKTTDPSTVLTLSSETVCQTKSIDSKYCLNNLSAKVYLADAKSDKWVILIHGNSMNAKQMFNATGKMYTDNGYNVLAPDLRGAGDSGGSVAMGYLESLDVYDWIKDLNNNYQTRYGVSTAPSTIIVHGVSLGGATTLQVATNPDIAAANGTSPYTKNLTDLKVKGFVDDCGYTSMTGIITGMLSNGSSTQTSTITSWIDVDKSQFFNTVQSEAKDLNIDALKDYDFNSVTSNGNIKDYLEKFSNSFNQVVDQNKQTLPDGSTEYTVPNVDQDTVRNFLSGLKRTDASTNNYTASKMTNSTLLSSNLTDTLVKKVLMKLVGTGLTDDNYDKYSNIFSAGRRFPAGSKVVIIHGTSDTIVPHSNSDVIANHLLTTNDANLLYKWDVDGAPHAFIVVGSHKTEYTNLVKNFSSCVADSSNCSKFSSSDTTAALK